MKQLIPQLKIDKAAREHALIKNDEHEITFMLSKSDFKSGVQFALNEIQPLICEFTEWCAENYCSVVNEKFKYWLKGYYQNKDNSYTTQQLLEEFINSKNK